MRFLKLTVAYDGADYCGWQVQDNGPSVQEKLEKAWTKITGEKIRITASGRTDSGVHARGQVCSLSTETKIVFRKLRMALNTYTPYDICVLEIQVAPDGFHAIRQAVGKTYRYRIQYGPLPDVHSRRQVCYRRGEMDIVAIEKACRLLEGEHDFACFQATGSDRPTTVRTISEIRVEPYAQDGFQFVDLVVTANGFLYNMMRNIAGSLMDVGQGVHPPEWMTELIAGKDRGLAGKTAPPQGLILEHVEYDVEFAGEAE